jgi:hypothetical protein
MTAEPADHGLGRSRSGLTTKIHLACEQGQKALTVIITARQRATARSSSRVLEAVNAPAILTPHERDPQLRRPKFTECFGSVLRERRQLTPAGDDEL